MGRGDKRTRRGKIFKGSYGNVRPHKVRTFVAPAAAPVKAPKTLGIKKKYRCLLWIKNPPWWRIFFVRLCLLRVKPILESKKW